MVILLRLWAVGQEITFDLENKDLGLRGLIGLA